MQAYDHNDKLVDKLESKEGEEIESFFDKCASVFQKEEVARMEIFKRRDAQLVSKVEQLELELEAKDDKYQPKPYYREKERY